MQLRITLSEIASVVIVCYMLATEYLNSASPMAAYYQHACQRFTLTLKLLLYRIPIQAFQY